MKKVALLIALMTIIAFTAFAADIAVAVTGSAELTFGVNLEGAVTTGFARSTSQDITFTLVSGDSAKGAEEAVYGEIKVSGWGVTYDSDNGTTQGWAGVDEGDLSAKIIFPNGWVDILSQNNSIGYMNIVQDDDANTGSADAGLGDTLAASAGAVLGLKFAPITVEIGVFSEADWTADNNYAASLKATVDAAPIKIEAGVLMGLNHSDTGIGLGGKVTATALGPIDIYAGADVTIDGATTVLEFGAGLKLAIAGITLTADMSYNENIDGMDVKAVLDASGIVANLGLALTLELYNLSGAVGADLDADAEMAVTVALSYTTPKAKPYANVRYGTFTCTDNAYTYLAANALKINVGVELYLITNVTFVLDYNTEDVNTNNGIIKFITKMAL